MKPILLYHGNDFERDELAAASRYFECTRSRLRATQDRLVVCRYSVEFYDALEADVQELGGKLLNSYRQRMYVADIFNWYDDLRGITPKTWFRMEDVEGDGPFVLKGSENSRKFSWDSRMYAATRADAVRVYCALQEDGLIQHQNVCIRQYVPLHTYLTGFRGLPISKEFRFFICDGQVLSSAYYWSNYYDDLPVKPDPSEVPPEFIAEVIRRVGDRIRFWVVDIAQTAEGEWIVIELNDGSMSGLSCNEPDVLYRELARVLNSSASQEVPKVSSHCLCCGASLPAGRHYCSLECAETDGAIDK